MTRRAVLATVALLWSASAQGADSIGYYRMPALSGDTLVFVAEGDLWRASASGGTATRLTTHAGAETRPTISPDGSRVSFTATYEGPAEIYVMPLAGGLPKRLTFDGARHRTAGWTPDGRVVFATTGHSTLPDWQLATVDPETAVTAVLPLAQAVDGAFDPTGRVLAFVRVAQGSFTKRYRGGTAESLWRFDEGSPEAIHLTADYTGTSRSPSFWEGRIVFASDRDGTLNVWSMLPSGKDLRQHTRHDGWDVTGLSAVSAGRVAYQLGADLRVLDLATGTDRAVPLNLESDFDQTREQWIDEPMQWVTSAHISPDGARVALTARGQVHVAPTRQGRLVRTGRANGVRHRDARFMPDGQSLLALSDESGEVELWTLRANGVGEPTQLTSDGDVLRWEGVPSPDGKFIAHHDKNQRLWLLDLKRQRNVLVEENAVDHFRGLAWSPDSRWLAYDAAAANGYRVLRVHHVDGKSHATVTSDRFDSSSAAWSPDGQWLYFLSERHLASLVGSPWGPMQPEPFFDRTTKVYALALAKGARSPFAPDDELHPADSDDKDEKDEDEKSSKKGPSARAPVVHLDLDGLAERLHEVPVPPGNLSSLSVTNDNLFFMDSPVGLERQQHLKTVLVQNHDIEVKTFVEDVKSYELSLDGKKLLVRKGDAFHVLDAKGDEAPKLEKTAVDLSGWKPSLIPREAWRQMFTEAWRLERDYFYDQDLHGVDWKAMLAKYLPLVDRVSDRAELSDLVSQLVSELSALHTFVYGGDHREGEDDVVPAALGATFERDEQAGGFRVVSVTASDPDRPEIRSPLAAPGVGIAEGDVLTQVDGTPALSAPALPHLLRNKAGRQVLLEVRPKAGGAPRSVVVTPLTPAEDRNLRYQAWELERRRRVEVAGGGDLGYVHLKAMGTADYADWARNFYPVFTRQGLIVDVRHNGGGNIDSWILSRLMRKAWFYWSQRAGRSPSWNMQWAFRGHVVVLCDEKTGSDGEAFTEGFRRLGLGQVIGTRTWGGEIWLSSDNFLVDGGIATAAEYGVYGPEGEWLIEGHGVDPDIVVDNLPHATFAGGDAQLDAAIAHLKELIRTQPVPPPEEPAHPNKSFRNGRGR